MYKQDKLTPGQEEDKKEHRKQLKALHKTIFQNGPNRANPWAKKKPVGESMTFMQHLLAEGRPERPTTMSHGEKTQLMELLSKVFVVSQVTDMDTDIIYQMANQLSDVLDKIPEGDEEGISGGFPNEESNSDFMGDEEEEVSGATCPHCDGSGKVDDGNWYNEKPCKACDGSGKILPGEEEESHLPAVRDRAMVSRGERNRTPTERGGVTSNKRNAQMAGRKQRSMHGKGTGGGNYIDNLFGKGGRPEDYD